ncbi:hypothetical protein AVEN_180201-1 [Araneus ventricosus]|uniref:Uncharacterized protein n=1 Tax=Araneus ventricosus TaxID=182803 RepID=A0A4Y2QUS5_ARAVE|nr:hypothetical protein AVEN_180201-1 [Araneus ventricosus]
MRIKDGESVVDYIKDVERKGRRVGMDLNERKRTIEVHLPEDMEKMKFELWKVNQFDEQTLEYLEAAEKKIIEEKKLIKEIKDSIEKMSKMAEGETRKMIRESGTSWRKERTRQEKLKPAYRNIDQVTFERISKLLPRSIPYVRWLHTSVHTHN